MGRGYNLGLMPVELDCMGTREYILVEALLSMCLLPIQGITPMPHGRAPSRTQAGQLAGSGRERTRSLASG